jgi:hypothetical protein
LGGWTGGLTILQDYQVVSAPLAAGRLTSSPNALGAKQKGTYYNVFYHSSGQISHPAAPPKRVLLSVQLLHNHKIKIYEILD